MHRARSANSDLNHPFAVIDRRGPPFAGLPGALDTPLNLERRVPIIPAVAFRRYEPTTRSPIMTRFTMPIIVLAGVCVRPAAAQGPDTHDTRLLSQPAISETHIAFVYDGDIWVAGRDGAGPRRMFRKFAMGLLIGKRTWGGLVGTLRNPPSRPTRPAFPIRVRRGPGGR